MTKSRLLTVFFCVLLGAMNIQAQRGLAGTIAGNSNQRGERKAKNQKSSEFEVNNDAGISIKYGVLSDTERKLYVTGGKGFYSKVIELVIPETVNYNGATYTVTEIGPKAFGSIMFGGCRIESVVLPSTITKIGEEGFALCGRLNTINLPEGLVEIGKRAFCGTLALNNIYIPTSVRRIDDGAFWTGLTGGLAK